MFLNNAPQPPSSTCAPQLPQFHEKTLGIGLVLETDHRIVGVAHEDHLPIGGEFAKRIRFGPFRAVLRAKAGMVPFRSCANVSFSLFI
jgi:hypothetical protein